MSFDTTTSDMAALDDDVAQLDLAEQDRNVASPEEVAPSKRQKHVFPFFKLPRELRDKIYGEATTDIWIPLVRHDCWTDRTVEQIDCAHLESAPRVQLSLVSRRFKQEYEDEMARPSTDATLTIAFGYALYLHDRLNASLRRALARVHTLTLTHNYNEMSVFGSSMHVIDFKYFLETLLLPQLRSLGHLKLVYHDTFEDFRDPLDFSLYQPEHHDPDHVRRIFSAHFDDGFDDSIGISCSAVLSEALFSPRDDSSSGFPGCYKGLAVNRVLFHGPWSLDPEDTDMAALIFDEVESSSFEQLEEYHKQRRALATVPGHEARLWTAGYRMVFEP